MHTRPIVTALVAALGVAACRPADALPAREEAPEIAAPVHVPGVPDGLFTPLPASAPALPGNDATADKLDLGRMLFFEPRLSASGLISCNTCHNLGFGGVDQLETSVGHGWQRGPRNAPTVLNAVYNGTQFWDGRAADLEQQAKGPVQAGVEMNSKPERVLATLSSIPEYVRRFQAAFPGEAEPLTFDNMARAIAVFEATLITPDARFDRYLRGDTAALDGREKEGLALFVDRGCSSCHKGVNLGGDGYHRFGAVRDPAPALRPAQDRGRAKVTGDGDDAYVFRTPTLRNIELTPPYFHSGTVWSLDEAVTVMGRAQLGAELAPDEAGAIAAFLRTLTGRQPEVAYPVLPPRTQETPRPELGVPSVGE